MNVRVQPLTPSNGANLSFPKEFGIGRSITEPGGERDEWLVGLVNASVYISAAFVGCWSEYASRHPFGSSTESCQLPTADFSQSLTR